MTISARIGLLAVPFWLAGPAAMAGDFVLSLQQTGLRDYYCQITVALENRSDAPLTEISGHVLSFAGDAQVGRSKGAWFMNVAPGEAGAATFETPNAPCEAVTRYAFVIGACRIDGPGFADTSACTARMAAEVPMALHDGGAG